ERCCTTPVSRSLTRASPGASGSSTTDHGLVSPDAITTGSPAGCTGPADPSGGVARPPPDVAPGGGGATHPDSSATARTAAAASGVREVMPPFQHRAPTPARYVIVSGESGTPRAPGEERPRLSRPSRPALPRSRRAGSPRARAGPDAVPPRAAAASS